MENIERHNEKFHYTCVTGVSEGELKTNRQKEYLKSH